MEITDCKPCKSKLKGAIDLKCIGCCVRLVRSARPSRARQNAMLEVIRKTPGTPERDAIIEAMKKGE